MNRKFSRILFLSFAFFYVTQSEAQNRDSLDNERLARMIELSEVVVRTDINVAAFIDRVKKDTSFYKAFRNLRILGFTSLNDILIVDKRGKPKASLQSRTRQKREHGCRSMDVLSESTKGDFYEKDSSYRYYTAELYASLFFTRGSVCGENNIVGGTSFETKGKSGIAKHKEQLKMLFFNPGKKIPGIPFIGNKINIFDPDVAALYDFMIDRADYEGRAAFVFSVKARENLSSADKNKIVIDNMVTWFDARTMEVLARNYRLSYDAGVYDFDVTMEVKMARFEEFLVPTLIRYSGNWDVMLKKRERGFFTATLFDFSH